MKKKLRKNFPFVICEPPYLLAVARHRPNVRFYIRSNIFYWVHILFFRHHLVFKRLPRTVRFIFFRSTLMAINRRAYFWRCFIMDMNELKLMQNYPLSIKISKTQFRIREFYEYFNGEVYVAFSGGNDSLVMLHIIRSMYPDVKAVFVDTGVEFPEVRKFVKTFDNVIFLKPQKNFSQIITDYGYPIISKDVSNSIRLARKNIIEGKDTYRVRQFDGSQKGSRFDKSKWKFLLDAPFKISEQCCDELKKKPFKKFEKETGLKGYIGVLASEGGVRLQGYLKTGCNNYRFGNSKPLGFWTHQDILQYIKIYNLNMCPVYGDLIFDEARNKLVVTGEPRTGCMGCMFGCHLEKSPNRFERMKISHPHMYNYFIEKLNFKSVLDYINIKY